MKRIRCIFDNEVVGSATFPNECNSMQVVVFIEEENGSLTVKPPLRDNVWQPPVYPAISRRTVTLRVIPYWIDSNNNNPVVPFEPFAIDGHGDDLPRAEWFLEVPPLYQGKIPGWEQVVSRPLPVLLSTALLRELVDRDATITTLRTQLREIDQILHQGE